LKLFPSHQVVGYFELCDGATCVINDPKVIICSIGDAVRFAMQSKTEVTLHFQPDSWCELYLADVREKSTLRRNNDPNFDGWMPRREPKI
jgi:hypothetical protein